MNIITQISNAISTEPKPPNDEDGAGACANNTMGVNANETNVIFFMMNRIFSFFISNTFYKLNI